MNAIKQTGRMLRYVFLGGLLVSPFIFWPWVPVRFEVPRVWFVSRWIEVLGVLTVAAFLVHPSRRRLNTSVMIAAVSFFLVAASASVLGVDVQKSIVGNYYRGDGLLTLSHLVGFSFLVGLLWSHEMEKMVFRAIGIGSVGVSLWAFTDLVSNIFTGSVSTPWGGSVGVSFGNPNFLAGYLLVTLPFTARLSRFARVGVIIQTLAILQARSWGGVLGLVLFLGMAMYKRAKKRVRFLIAIATVAIFGGIGIWYSNAASRVGFLPGGRERIIRSVLRGVRERPLLGWGWANVDYAFESNPWPMQFWSDVYVDKAHGMLLEVLVTTGIIGLILYVFLLWTVGSALARSPLFPVFLLYLMHTQTNVMSIAEELLFWLMVGITMSSGVHENSIDHGRLKHGVPKHRHLWADRGRLVVAGASVIRKTRLEPA